MSSESLAFPSADRGVARPDGSEATGVFEGLKVLLAHDWILSWAGSERVVEQIVAVLPQAHVVTAIADLTVVRAHLPRTRVRQLWLGKVPGARSWYQWLLPIEAAAFALLPTATYDLVISSAHALAKAVHAGGRGIHLCYCHSPPRYLWDQYSIYYRFNSFARRTALRLMRGPLQIIDQAAARGVTHFVANSRFVARRIGQAYGRDARVVYPPVSPKAAGTRPLASHRGEFILYLGRLVAYKRVDLVVRAATHLGLRAVIAGEGPELRRLKTLAGPTVEFVGAVSEAAAAGLLETCAALVFCGEEDFGIALVEANAHGAPVVALRAGAVEETLVEGQTAIFFDVPTLESVCDAIRRALARSWDEADLRANAKRFGPERFRQEFTHLLAEVLEGAKW